jgi:hypothetical protein
MIVGLAFAASAICHSAIALSALAAPCKKTQIGITISKFASVTCIRPLRTSYSGTSPINTGNPALAIDSLLLAEQPQVRGRAG